MYKVRNKLIVVFSIVMITSSWLGWWLLFSVFKAEHIALYPMIPSFFLVTGLSVINILTNIKRDNPRYVANIYMIIKLSKLFLSVVMIVVLYLLLQQNAKELILTFGAFYLLYIFLELYIFTQTEKTDKQIGENEMDK